MATTRAYQQQQQPKLNDQDNLTSTATSNAVVASSYPPPTNFPDKFQDFFATLNEDADDLSNMLEDKLIPRKNESSVDAKNRRWGKRAFQRRSSEVEVRLHRTSYSSQGHSSVDGSKSPTPSRRRSSSIAVARPTPDLHRFLQAETGPWGHLSPSPRSPTRSSGTIVNSSITTMNNRISPAVTPSSAGPLRISPAASTTGFASSTTSRDQLMMQRRNRTSSMPAVPRHRPTLAEIRRSGQRGEEETSEDGVEVYRLRSFSITANGVSNLGDLLKSRRSKSINSVTSSSCSSTTARDTRLLSSASQLSATENEDDNSNRVATYKVGMLGASGVGKTALTAQFATSEYICAYDASLDEEYGQKSVSVMLDGQETELEIIDHPAAEMSVESFCATYNPDVYVVVYSVVDRRSLKAAEEMLLYLWKSDYMANHGVILVGNKVDLERKREIPSIMGRRIANNCGCKFIETSSGLAHHVDELLVGILAQIKLNPQRDRERATTRRKRSKHGKRILKHLLGFRRKTKSCENLFVL